MITFIVLCCIFIIVAGFLLAALAVGGVAVGTIGIVMLDMILGIGLLVLIFKFVRWLFKKI